MSAHFFSILLLTSSIFSQGSITARSSGIGYIKQKKERILRRAHTFKQQRKKIKEKIKQQREERETTGCCSNINAKDIMTMISGLVTLGMTITKFIIELAK